MPHKIVKRFKAAWFEPMYDQENAEVTLEFFSSDAGYTDREIAGIDKLQLGETYHMDGHSVRRIS